MAEVKIQKHTKVIVAFDETEAAELRQLLVLGNWQRGKWMAELDAELSKLGVFSAGVDMNAFVDQSLVEVVE